MEDSAYRVIYTSSFEVIVEENPLELSKELKERIDALWIEENKRRRKPLVDNPFFVATTWSAQGLKGRFVPYRAYFAQTRDFSVKEALSLSPVSVSGCVICRNAVLTGKRSAFVTDYPERYELAPAGGIEKGAKRGDRIDFLWQLRKELEEETGIAEGKYVSAIEEPSLIYDAHTNFYEICAKIFLKEDALSVPFIAGDEHAELRWVALESLPRHVHEKAFIPFSLYLLRYFRLLPLNFSVSEFS